jgi:methyl coenzyme M reductase subunit D
MSDTLTSFTVTFIRDGTEEGKRAIVRLPEHVPFDPIVELLCVHEAVSCVKVAGGQIEIEMHEGRKSLGVFFNSLRPVIKSLCAAAYNMPTADFTIAYVFPP